MSNLSAGLVPQARHSGRLGVARGLIGSSPSQDDRVLLEGADPTGTWLEGVVDLTVTGLLPRPGDG